MSDKAKSVSVLKWDGKADSCPRYLVKIRALAEFHSCGDTLDETEMVKCPTVTHFKVLSTQMTRSADEDCQIKLYKLNKRLCAIIMLGQESDHGLAVMEGTVEAGVHPHGLGYKFVKVLG